MTVAPFVCSSPPSSPVEWLAHCKHRLAHSQSVKRIMARTWFDARAQAMALFAAVGLDNGPGEVEVRLA